MSDTGHGDAPLPTWEDRLLRIHNDLEKRITKLEEEATAIE